MALNACLPVGWVLIIGCSLEVGALNGVVEDENEGASGSSDDVREGSLEEGLDTLLLCDDLEAVQGALVGHLLDWLSRLHHESSSDSVEWVGDNSGGYGYNLSDHPLGEHVGVLEEHDLGGIEETEVGGAVGDDTDNRDTESSVETLRTILCGDLREAVDESSELSGSTRTDISGETSSGEIEWVHEAEGGGTGGSTRSAVSDEELDWLLLGVVWVEDGLVEVLASEVDGLGGEVPDDVGCVSSPEGWDTLLLRDSGEAIANSIVPLIGWNSLDVVLHLEEKFDSLDRSDERLRDGSGNTAEREVEGEAFLVLASGALFEHL